jgi:hypothetical protein
MCGKCKYRFYRVICKGYKRPKAIEFDGGKTEMWKKFIASNIGATRIEEVSDAYSLISNSCSSSVSEQMQLLVSRKLLVWEHITSVGFGTKCCTFWKTSC